MNNLDKKLYELFADKTLSYGCKFLIQNELYSYVYCEGNENMLIDDMGYAKWRDDGEYDSYLLGHEPQLHDVFRVAKENGMFYFELNDDTIEFWNELGIQKDSMQIPYTPELPLLQQSENEYNEEGNLVKMGTKEQIISLFS